MCEVAACEALNRIAEEEKHDEAVWSLLRDATAGYSEKWKSEIELVPPTNPESWKYEPDSSALAVGWARSSDQLLIVNDRRVKNVIKDDHILATVMGRGPYTVLVYRDFVSGPEDVDLVFRFLEEKYPGPKGLTIIDQQMAGYHGFIGVTRGVWTKNLAQSKKEIDNIERNLISLWQKYLDLHRLVTSDQRTEDDLKEELKLIMSLGMPEFSREGDPYMSLSIVTKPITVTDIHDPKRSWKFGRYRVVFDLTSNKILIERKDAKWPAAPTSSYYHPHISTDGYPCWGNSGARIHELVASGRFGEACVLTREFLESYNEKGAFARLARTAAEGALAREADFQMRV